jgi:hypothetical protein
MYVVGKALHAGICTADVLVLLGSRASPAVGKTYASDREFVLARLIKGARMPLLCSSMTGSSMALCQHSVSCLRSR